jgi:hypothetical protein
VFGAVREGRTGHACTPAALGEQLLLFACASSLEWPPAMSCLLAAGYCTSPANHSARPPP